MKKEQIQSIKSAIDLKSYIESKGISLKKTGKNWFCQCPFHSEKNPSFSISPEKQLFHCFSCGVGGDIFSFVMKFDSIGFKDAFKKLSTQIDG
ncbi:MAG: hypothetical protein HQK76_19145 [Desulfobacterales bacterium]|nr:hypothetical protein [Desulfobacterales bacterium]